MRFSIGGGSQESCEGVGRTRGFGGLIGWVNLIVRWFLFLWTRSLVRVRAFDPFVFVCAVLSFKQIGGEGGMGGSQEKLLNQIFQLKFTAKTLVRQAKKCETEERSEKLKVKKAIEKGNMDGARIYAQNAIRKHNEQLNYLRLSSRLDAVVARLGTQSKMQTITKSMGSIVKALDSALAVGNMEKISQTMDQFEKTFVNMEVQSEFVESAMAGSTSLSTPEDDVNSLMHQVADDYGLEVSVGLPQAASHKPMSDAESTVSEDDLSRRLAELKSRG